MALPAQPDQLGEGAIFGHYQVVRRIGVGGMGSVYEATHTNLGKRFALKTLLPQYASNDEVRTRFLREGKLAAKLRHAHVVDVTDFGVQGDVPYLVMEFLEGEDLAKLIKREGRLTPAHMAEIILPITAGLASAHDQQIIHRDLKPQNIFLCQNAGGEVVPKLLDFGISKLLGDDAAQLTGSMNLMGTPSYMSPEQTRGSKNIDARSDQYALGVIVYECLTGAVPFVGDAVYTILRMIVEGQFRRPSEVVPDIPPELEATILTAMQNKPDDRFPSTWSFGAALLPYASTRTNVLWEATFARQQATYVAAPPAVDPPKEPVAQASPRFVTSPGPNGEMLPPDSVGSGTGPTSLAKGRALSGGRPRVARTPTPQVDSAGSQPPEGPAERQSGRSPRVRTAARRALSDSSLESPALPAPPQQAPSAVRRSTFEGMEEEDHTEVRSPRRVTKTDVPLVSLAIRAPKVVLGAVAGVVVVAVGVGVMVWSGSAKPVPPAPTPLIPRGVPPAEPIHPQQYDVQLDATPAEAQLFLDGAPVGAGHFQRPLDKDGTPHTMEARLDGYQTQSVSFKDEPPATQLLALQKSPDDTDAKAHRGLGTLHASGALRRAITLSTSRGEVSLGSVGVYAVTLAYQVNGDRLTALLRTEPPARISVNDGPHDSTNNGPVTLPFLSEKPVDVQFFHIDDPPAHLRLSFRP